MKLTHYDVVIEVLTPVHIGTGEEWYANADFVEERLQDQRLVRVIDAEVAITHLSPQDIARIRDGQIAAALGERLRRQFTKALLPVRGPGRVGRVRTMKRLPTGQPYIPGTTVKGSLRTALLQALFAEDQSISIPRDLGRNDRQAAAPLEERLFNTRLSARQFANRDLNRLLRVSDFVPEGDANAAVINVSAYRLDASASGRIPIWCEAIEPGARFRGTITLETDSALWNALSERQRGLLAQPFDVWFAAGRRLLEAEAQALASGPPEARPFFDRALREWHRAVPLGWGGGWRSKTVGLLLTSDQLARIADQYRLRRWRGREFPRRFPVTRKLVTLGRNLVPPSWVIVTVSPKGATP